MHIKKTTGLLFAFLYRKPFKTVTGLSDEELITGFRTKGDPEMIGLLFDRYIHLVYGVCLKYLKDPVIAEDAAMDVFESLFELMRKHQIKKFPAWLYRVTSNHCLMILRRSKTRDSKPEFSLDEERYAGFMENAALMHLNDEVQSVPDMEKAIAKLKEEQRSCLKLFYFENRSYKDIAGITGMSVKNVKSHIQNGKRNLKLILERNNEKA